MIRRRSYLLIGMVVGYSSLPTVRAGNDAQAPPPVLAPSLSGGGVAPPAPVPPADEAAALGLVNRNLPELAGVLAPLQAANPVEYRKAMADLAAEARRLDEIRARNPARADLALEDWKARTRVELIAAQLASSPDPEKASELRRAIEARVDQAIRRHQFEVDQGEANVKRLRENLAHAEANRDKARTELKKAEANRDAKVENRYQALTPRKKATAALPKGKSKAAGPPAPPPTNPARSSRADRTSRGGGAVPLRVAAVPGHAVSLPTPPLVDDSIPLPAAPALVEGEIR